MSRRIHVLIQGEQFGPYPENEFCQHLADKKILRSDLVWREGLAEWIPAGDLVELITAAPPPAKTDAGPPEPVTVPAAKVEHPALPRAQTATADDAPSTKVVAPSGRPSVDPVKIENIYREGLRQANGDGVPRDNAAALTCFRQAAEAGHAVAECSLGYLLEHGRGTARDEAGALIWYRKAANRGDAIAQNNLALMLAQGRGVSRNEAEAMQWFRRAAQQGVPAAQSNLGLQLAQGRGAAADPVEALKWFSLAAAQGHTAAIKNRDLLLPELTAEQTAEAQKRAAQFVVQRTPGLQAGGLALGVCESKS